MKLNKFLIGFIIISILAFGLLVINKITGGFQYYIVQTSGNEPTIKNNSYVFSSSFIQHEKFDFIIHERNDSTNEKWIQRLCAIEGDKIQITKGKLFVNDTLVDSIINPNHAYLIDSKQANWLKYKNIKQSEDIISFKMDTFIVHITSNELNKKLYNEIYLDTIPNEMIRKAFDRNWSVDEFGPIIVPVGKSFVLGDNRNQSLDSRFIGFINNSDIKAIIIGKN